jgi:hypothetical protein
MNELEKKHQQMIDGLEFMDDLTIADDSIEVTIERYIVDDDRYKLVSYITECNEYVEMVFADCLYINKEDYGVLDESCSGNYLHCLGVSKGIQYLRSLGVSNDKSVKIKKMYAKD